MNSENRFNELSFISKILKNKGFINIKFNTFNKNLRWAYSIFAENNKEAIAIEYRKDEKIPYILLERITGVKYNKNLRIFILFERLPSKGITTELSKKGIGIFIFKNNKLFLISNSKNFSKKKIEKIKFIEKGKKSPKAIYVYPCSIQEAKERRKLFSIIEDINHTHKVPIFTKPPEEDLRDNKKFRKNMLRNMRECDIFIAALHKEYSDNVEFEIRNCFNLFNDSRLILISKKNFKINTFNPDENEIIKKYKNYPLKDIPDKYKEIVSAYKTNKLIDYLAGKIKYLPYNNITEFERIVRENLMKMISHIFRKQKIVSPFEMSS